MPNASTFDYCSGFDSRVSVEQPQCTNCLQQLRDDYYISNCGFSMKHHYSTSLVCVLTHSLSSFHRISCRLPAKTKPWLSAFPARQHLRQCARQHHDTCTDVGSYRIHPANKWSCVRRDGGGCDWWSSIGDDYTRVLHGLVGKTPPSSKSGTCTTTSSSREHAAWWTCRTKVGSRDSRRVGGDAYNSRRLWQ